MEVRAFEMRTCGQVFPMCSHQEMVYFSQDDHTMGALTSALSLHPTQEQHFAGTNFPLMLIVVVSFVGVMIVAVADGWKWKLVLIFGGMPFICAGYPQYRL